MAKAAAVTERQGRGDHGRRPRDRQGDRDGAGAQGLPRRHRRPRAGAGGADRGGARRRHVALPLDVTDRASFAKFLDEAERQLGPVDVVINNAGIMPVTALVDESDDSIKRQLDINIYGVIVGTQLAIERMRPRGSGHIVNIASQAGKTAIPGIATYSGTKHAVVGISEAVRGRAARQRRRSPLRDADRGQHRTDRRASARN